VQIASLHPEKTPTGINRAKTLEKAVKESMRQQMHTSMVHTTSFVRKPA
jgi:hypothetical protein